MSLTIRFYNYSGQLQHLPEHEAGQAGEGQEGGGHPRPL